MDAYTSRSSSSSSSNLTTRFQRRTREPKSVKPPQYSQSSLHSIRKPQLKPCKKPIAPFPPTPPKIYQVDPINFRDLVQKLTGAPETAHQLPPDQRRLQTVLAAPPLFNGTPSRLLPSPADYEMPTSSAAFYHEYSKAPESNYMVASSFLELNLSPSSYSWCSFPLQSSPRTLPGLERSAVL